MSFLLKEEWRPYVEEMNACPRPVPNPIKWKRRGDKDEDTVVYADEGPIQYDADEAIGGEVYGATDDEEDGTGDKYGATDDEVSGDEYGATDDEYVATGDADVVTGDEDPMTGDEYAGAKRRQQSEYSRIGTFWIPPLGVPTQEQR